MVKRGKKILKNNKDLNKVVRIHTLNLIKKVLNICIVVFDNKITTKTRYIITRVIHK